MGYGKIDTTTNYLMSSSTQLDVTWLPLSSFVEKSPGVYYTYYTNVSTPDMVKENAYVNGIRRQEIDLLLDEGFVTYNGKDYSTSTKSILQLVSATALLSNLNPNETQAVFTKDSEIVDLTRSDLETIIALEHTLVNLIIHS